MKKTNFDRNLEEQLQDPEFAERFEAAGEAWEVAIEIARLREEAGLSQKELAQRLGTTQQQVSRLESPAYEGHSLSMLHRVAKALNARVHVAFKPEQAPPMHVAEDSRKYGPDLSESAKSVPHKWTNRNAPPVIHIIAGSNGAGKTTFARQILPNTGVDEFLNADLIAAGLSPLHPETSVFEAGRLLLKRWHALASKGQSFAFETTLSGRTYADMLSTARQEGFVIRLTYLWIPSVNIALKRIRNRVKKGGHNVPEKDVRRRYPVSLRHFFQIYLPLADDAALWDVSVKPPRLVADWFGNKLTIHHPTTYERIQKQIVEDQI